MRVYYKRDHFEFNKLLSGGISIDLFYLYHDIHINHKKPFEERNITAPTEDIGVTKQIQFSSQVAFYCSYLLGDSGFLKSERYLKFGSPRKFIFNEGALRNVSGESVYKYYRCIMGEKERIKEMKRRQTGRFFIDEAIKMLEDDGYHITAKVAITERDKAFPRS